MSDEQNRNRNEWAQLNQGDYIQSPQQHSYVPEGYAPVQGYAPAEALNRYSGYSDYQDSTASSYDIHQIQGANSYTVEDDDIPEEEIRDPVSSRRQKRKSKTTAEPKEKQPKSKRAERRERIAIENQGEVSATDKPKGLVEWREGVFQWWDPEDKEWLKAAYHDVFRTQFIREDRTEGTYVVAPDRGKGPDDVTSACSAFNQLEWRLTDRDSWDNIVDADGNKVLYLLDPPEHQSYDEPERLWIHDGCVLLDGDNNPVRPWTGIPRCFSSKIEGGRMEALRRILPMTIQDFRARMLRAVPTGAGIGAGTKPLSFPSTFGHRSSRFRAQYLCPAWLSRAASAVLKKQVTDLLPEAEEATTTEGLQALSRHEVERRKSSTRGKFLYKAAGRAISADERNRRERKLQKKLARQAVRQTKTPQRPQSMPVTPWQPDSPSPYLPTPPLSAGNKRRRENDGLGYFNVGQSEPAAKRGRLDASPLNARSQGRLPTPEDPLQQAPDSYDTSGTFSSIDPHHGHPGMNAVGLGLNFGGGDPVNHQNLTPSQNTSVPEPHPQQPEATYTEGTASTYSFQSEDNSQLDYRFVVPRNPLEQLSIQAALLYPRTHYYALIRENPPHTSEGTYRTQYLQILTLLEQNWVGPDSVPLLADVGQWNGSFSMVPTPNLPDGVLEIMLRPTTGTPPGPESSTQKIDVENVQTASSSNIRPEHDGESSGWSDDMFAEYLDGIEDADGDGE